MNVVDYFFENSRNQSSDLLVGREQTSYQDLYDLVLRLSARLHEEVGEGEKIILLSDNSLFFIVSYLGIIHSGNICVPLNPAITVKSLEHIAGQCKTKIAFIEKKHQERFDTLSFRKIDQSILKEIKIFPEKHAPDSEFDEESIAEILFTSGSTALPKGVMLSHRNLMANTESIISYLNLTDKDRMEVVLPFYYCYGLSLLHTHLRVGGSLVLNNAFIMLHTVIDDLITHQCTGFAGVPSHYQILLRKYKRFKKTSFPHLRYVTQAGGKLANPFIEEFLEAFPDKAFVVMYGQTEATARLSYLPPSLLPQKLGSIGRGIPGVKLDVIDESGETVSPGKIGELVASGRNVMSGYFEDKKLTSETIKNGNLYTGDIGTVDEDGFIFVLAREKEYLKVGGERISPKEIEEAIVRLPGVVDCSIIGVDDDILGEAIKAYIVCKDGVTLDENNIRKHCNHHLSSTKVPSYIQIIDKIPVSATGKKIRADLQRLGK